MRMQSGILELVNIFVRTVEVGSFTAVAEEMKSTQPTVSRQIGALEAHVGARLLNRTTRSLELTEEGRVFYHHAIGLVAAAAQATASVAAAQGKAFGTIRVSGTTAFTRIQVIPRMKRFLAKWPEVNVNFELSDLVTDIVEENIDVAIRLGYVVDENLIVVRVGNMRRMAVATPDYVEKHGFPQHPEDLKSHNCIIFNGLSSPNVWQFADNESGETIRVKVSGRISSNSADVVGMTAFEGNGIAILPSWSIPELLDEGKVVRLLERYEAAPMPISLVYPARRPLPARTQAFISFITDEFSKEPLLSSSHAALLEADVKQLANRT